MLRDSTEDGFHQAFDLSDEQLLKTALQDGGRGRPPAPAAAAEAPLGLRPRSASAAQITCTHNLVHTIRYTMAGPGGLAPGILIHPQFWGSLGGTP